MLDAAPAPGVARLPPLTDRRVLLVVGVVSGTVHALAIAAGLRFARGDLGIGSLSEVWQLLPISVLRHGLIGGLAHLHSQPPLFNLFTGALLQLPHATQAWAAVVALAACSVVIAVATAGLLLEFELRRALVLGLVVLFVLADPAQFLYTTFYFYALPTAALATATGWAAVRWVRTERAAPGAAFGVLAALLILTNSSFQLYTVAIATVPILWVLRHRWRQCVAVLIVPLVVVAGWYVNDLVQFHTFTTTSWFGMNLARSTLVLDSKADINRLVQEGVLSPAAKIRPFSPLDLYGPLGVHPRTGVTVLDQRLKYGGTLIPNPNYDNIAYLRVSSQYLKDDLAWIEHRPAMYLKHTTIGLRFWMLPAEQFYGTVESPHYHLGGYTTVYDAVVLLQPRPDPSGEGLILNSLQGPDFSNLSYTTVLEWLLAMLVLPVVAWRRRRVDRALAAGALWTWVICASVFVTTTLVEAAENNRFRFELGGLPLVAATVAVAWLIDRSGLGGGLLSRASGKGDRGAGERLAVDDEPPRVPAGGGEGERAQVDGHRHVDGRPLGHADWLGDGEITAHLDGL